MFASVCHKWEYECMDMFTGLQEDTVDIVSKAFPNGQHENK